MKRIGPYTVLEELGRGGMAVVYRARDAAGRDVALKVLPRDKGAKALRRFEREVSALGQFAQHPHVVNVHAAGEADGVAYFAMALAAHGSLTQRVSRRGAYAPEAAARLAADLAEGLIAAHSHGVLHRDLKPDNVLFNDADEAVVSDFGLARQVVDAESLTQSGNMLGSPGYMAPEQIRGDGDEQGERTDVYGLGATLYFALTGQAPFEGEHLAGIVHGTLEERPAAPSTLNPAVPPDLDQLCLRCLEKDPAARYPSMAALHAELTAFLAGVPIAAEQSRLAKVAVAACVLTALSVTASWLVVRGRSATEAAEQGLHGPRAPKPEPRLG
ncbi:MAG: serine/threonine protein kinase, partial [Planctomycetes bacterium]|nr:serine/threonine protein kinase [Planctomycetota bacterium]